MIRTINDKYAIIITDCGIKREKFQLFFYKLIILYFFYFDRSGNGCSSTHQKLPPSNPRLNVNNNCTILLYWLKHKHNTYLCCLFL